MKYDLLVVGAGLYGAVLQDRLQMSVKKSLFLTNETILRVIFIPKELME